MTDILYRIGRLCVIRHTLAALFLLAVLILMSLWATAGHLQHKRKHFNVSGGGTSPGTTSLRAWWDFDDSGGEGHHDSHSVGPYDFSEIGTFDWNTGTPSYATFDDADGNGMNNGDIDDVWGNTDSDFSVFMRVRIDTVNVDSGDYVFTCNGARNRTRWYTATGEFQSLTANQDTANFDVANDSDWHTICLVFDGDSDTGYHYYDGSLEVTDNGVASFAAGVLRVGYNNTSTEIDMDIDHMSMWNRELTADEITWLHNAGGTRTYSEL